MRTFLAIGILGLLLGAARASDEPVDVLDEATSQVANQEWEVAATLLADFVRERADSPRVPEARFWLGMCHVKLGESQQALDVLRPFEGPLADDPWQDDALLQLGYAYHAMDEWELAISSWNTLLEKHLESPWRNEAYLSSIDLLFHDASDPAACLEVCQRMIQEVHDLDQTLDARYLGAYCLNAMERFDDADQWMNAALDDESALEEAWRQVLSAQRALLDSKPEAALATVAALESTFPELDLGSRLDLVWRASSMLRLNGQAGQAREMLLATLRRTPGIEQAWILALLEELADAVGEQRPADYMQDLAALASDATVAPLIRVAAREEQIERYRDHDQAPKALALLRDVLATETADFVRYRAATLLAEILAMDQEEPAQAINLLTEELNRLKRRDLAEKMRVQLNAYQTLLEAPATSDEPPDQPE